MKRIKTMAGSSIFILMFVLLVGGMLLVTPYLASIGGSGMTINSIQTTKIISNDADIAGAWFHVFTTLGGGQHMEGTVSPSQFKSESGYETEQTLKVEASTTAERVTYNIINDRKTLYKYTVSQMETCPTNVEFKIPLVFYTLGFKTFDEFICVDKTYIGTKGSFTNPTVGFSSDLSVTVGSEKITREISSTDSDVSSTDSNVDFTDNFGNILAQASWSGSMMTGDQAPNQDNYVAYYASRYYLDTDKWHVAYKDDYTEWIASKSATDISLQEKIDFFFECDSPEECTRFIENIVDNPNRKLTTIMNSDYKLTDDQNTINAGSLEGSSIRVTLDRQILNPTVTWKIKASKLGVVIPVSKPRILGVTSDEFGSGEYGKITVQVKNDGDVGAEFTSSFSGCSPFEMRYSAPRTYFEKGEIKYIDLFVSTGDANYDLFRVCTVRVQDSNKASNYNELGVDVSMTSAKICTLNTISIEGPCIYKCTDEKKQPVQQVCCDHGIGYDTDKADTYDGYYCKIEPSNECETDADCDDDIDWTKDWCETDFFGKKSCVHKDVNVCRTDTDCDDDNWLTIDTCEKSIIGGIVGSEGTCSFFDIRPALAVLGIIALIIGLIIVGLFGLGIAAIIKKK